MELRLKYGKGEIAFEIEKNRLLECAEPKPLPTLLQIDQAIAHAMDNPRGPRLSDVVKAGHRVLLLTVDLTRPSPKRLLAPILAEVQRLGARADIMVALGNHRPMNESELREHLGTSAVLQSESKGPVWVLGKTASGTPIEVDRRLKEYDVRIAAGFVEPSYLLGFTGGRKIIMPGAASSRAIAHNHFLLLAPGPKLGVLGGNPLNDDAMEFAKTVGLHWVLDVVLNPDDSYAAIYCGDMVKAHAAACADAGRIYTHPIRQKADIVVVSSGGHPYDFDFVQTKKGLVPAMACVKEGGTIILAGKCPDGWGGEGAVSKEALTRDKPDLILKELKQHFETHNCPWELAPCSSRYLLAKAVAEMKCQVIAVTGINADLSRTFIEVAESVADALRLADRRLGANASVTVIPDGRRLIPTMRAQKRKAP